MNKSNHNLGKTLIILGIGLIMLIWLTAFNMSINTQDNNRNLLYESSYFDDFEMDLFESGTFSNVDTEGYKVIIYNGWAPWCSACVNEMPALEKLYEEYKDKGILVVGVVADYYEDKLNYGDDGYEEDIKNTIEAYGITYPIVLTDERFTQTIKPSMENTFPTTWIVDENGNVIDYFIGGIKEDAWRKVFDKYLDEVNEG